jgi:hypothetical protein
MERPQFLIDSNAIIDFLGNKLPVKGMNFMKEVVSQIPVVSVISKIEILGFRSSSKKTSIDFRAIAGLNLINPHSVQLMPI